MSEHQHRYTFQGFGNDTSPYWLARAARKAKEELEKIPEDKRSPATKILLGQQEEETP